MNSEIAVMPPDEDQRCLIERDLDSTMVVEAAAGTGKTTSMIRRMVALLRKGKCRIHNLAAVTFTRKAAAELRSRFQLALETALRQADASDKSNLEDALSRIEGCFIGTIHSFCARLLRERPVEAQVDVSFQEIDENTDLRIRNKAWDEYVGRLFADNDPILSQLDALGIEIGHLRPSFEIFANYPDIAEWPAAEASPPHFDEVRRLLGEVEVHVTRIQDDFPVDYSDWDELMRKFTRVRRMITHADPEKPRDLVAILRQFTDIEIKKVKFDKWPEGERRAREERSTWQDYKKRSDAYLDDWRRHCYHTLIKAIQGCQAVYDRLREEKGLLNFQDLLLKAAALLADKPKIREYFRHRFTRLLVDEFQDTDPIQAQVMMFLTANDPTETDWQRCRPVPGSLFVVGDPKQSIYRFRRADIVTYNKVKEIIVNNGGKIVLLQANFRSAAPLIDWINRTFEKSFSSSESPESPAYVTLLPGPQAGEVCQQPHLQCLQIPPDVPTDQICEYEATLVARAILDAINDNGVPPESRTASGRVDARPAQPRDFLIITRYTKNLGVYSRKLQEAGIPHQVVGGNAVNQSRELSMLHVCLAAVVQPDNPVALVAALRSELFGISDSALYDFKQKGGSFSFASSIPTGLADADAAALSDAFERLRKYSVWFNIMPSVAAAEKVAADLGLAVLSAAEPDGNSRAGSFLKAFELLRAVHYDLWAATDLVDYLAQILQGEEVHDGLPALPQETSAVQVMNLHKAKGLEAPFVFLADPTGEINHGTDLYIDRSGDEVKGYMVIRGPTAGFAGPVLGMPQQWNTLKAQEKRFRDAESTRLFYVAATRAGKQLTITQRGKIKQGGNRWNPWKFFQDHLLECPILVDRGGDRELKVNPVSIGDEDAWRAEAQIGGRWRVVAQPTYETAGAKAISMARPTLAPPGAEYGTEWGSILHSLLETAMLNDRADLGSLAQTALAEQGLAADLVEDLVETVHAVMASDIWKRAMHSPRRLVEVPFQTLVSTESGEAGPVATILRGVIDLAFLEAGAWVIVDYKTDRVSSTHLGRLVERYREQVLTYAKAWAAVTGEIVGEVGLFFTHCDRYVVL